MCFKVAPTLQQKLFPALAEAPPISLLRLAENNCKKQQVAGPSGSETPAPGKAQSKAKAREQKRFAKDGLWPPCSSRVHAKCPQSTSTPTSLENTPGRQRRRRGHVILSNSRGLKLGVWKTQCCYEKETKSLCHECQAKEGQDISPVHLSMTQHWSRDRFGPNCLQRTSRGTKQDSFQYEKLWHVK